VILEGEDVVVGGAEPDPAQLERIVARGDKQAERLHGAQGVADVAVISVRQALGDHGDHETRRAIGQARREA
jgi:hypothetical protein